jgi:UDP-2-acetamido-3-amino-2,3-dideoxy-glucuronate N-acetyltransferase
MTRDEQVHPSAVVEPGARIGPGTRVWHFCHIMPGAEIGENCQLGMGVFVDRKVRIGNRVKIQNQVSLYTGIVVEDDVFLGPSAVFTNVLNPRSFIERKDAFRTTLLRRGCTIGANATILCGTVIGAYALVGAGAVITTDVPAHAVVMGNPARQQGWISCSGGKLDFDAAGNAWCEEENAFYRKSGEQVTGPHQKGGFEMP